MSESGFFMATTCKHGSPLNALGGCFDCEQEKMAYACADATLEKQRAQLGHGAGLQQQAVGMRPLTAAQHLEAARQSIAAALEIIGKVK